jgi:hypothetical protein
MPKSIRVFSIPDSLGLMVAFDQMSEADHNDNWTELSSSVSIRGDAVLFRAAATVDEVDRDKCWQLMMGVPLVPVNYPVAMPSTKERGRFYTRV